MGYIAICLPKEPSANVTSNLAQVLGLRLREIKSRIGPSDCILSLSIIEAPLGTADADMFIKVVDYLDEMGLEHSLHETDYETEAYAIASGEYVVSREIAMNALERGRDIVSQEHD